MLVETSSIFPAWKNFCSLGFKNKAASVRSPPLSHLGRVLIQNFKIANIENTTNKIQSVAAKFIFENRGDKIISLNQPRGT